MTSSATSHQHLRAGRRRFSSAQLRDYADSLRTVLLRVPGVAKVDYFGDQPERIYLRSPTPS